MSQARVTFVESFAVPPSELFAALADFDATGEWMPVKSTVVAGPPEGGVGTVRRLHLPGIAVDEEITYCDPPRRLVYRVVSRTPGLRFHRGEILVEPWGKTGSRLTWDILLESPIPGVPHVVAAGLRGPIRQGLANLRARFGARAA